jgi:hypothetical protein
VTTPVDCPNCGAALAGAYCSACGQKADVTILSLGRLLAEAIGEFYNFDSRMWRSLGTLVRHPGRLTRHYLEGKRARYTPPFRMYVVTSLTFFVVFALVRMLSADDTAGIAVDVALPVAPAPAESQANDGAAPVAAAQPEQTTLRITVDDDDLECTLNPDGLDPAVRERLEAACRRVEQDDGSFGREFADNFPVTMLVFIPIVAGIMKLLYLFARRKYVEHVLFFLHVHTFFFVVALLTAVLSGVSALMPGLRIPVWIAGIAGWLYFFVYLYVAMREVYGQSNRLTSLKYVALGASYFLAAVLTFLGAAFVTAATI